VPGSKVFATDIQDPPTEAGGLSCYQNGNQVFARWNNSIALGYRSHSSLKYPYFAPLAGPLSGLPLTTESSLPYPHHRGLWLGCDPLNGGDYWSDGPLEQGQIRSNGLKVDATHSDSVIITDSCHWVRSGVPGPLEDNRRFTFSIPSEHIRLLDVNIDVKAMQDVRVENAKHSFFALRVASDMSPIYGGTLMNSEGDAGATATFGRPAKWCGFFGRRAQVDLVEGIAIFNHPDNFGGNCPWFTRDYGHLSPSPLSFLKEPWTLERGAILSLRYCVVLHTGTPRAADLDGVYRQWVQSDGWFAARSAAKSDSAQPVRITP
jgi:hypothetical protein